ncbi:unnamed protein product [Auanema sp. JU1783]|nr:unnamed protein product [Auanema sp. JU1783]
MSDWLQKPSPTKAGRVIRTFGQDLESVFFAVITFLSGGVLLFITCFVITKCMQCYKARLRRKRRRAMGEDDDEEDELTAAVLSGAFEVGDDDEEERGSEEGRLVDL